MHYLEFLLQPKQRVRRRYRPGQERRDPVRRTARNGRAARSASFNLRQAVRTYRQARNHHRTGTVDTRPVLDPPGWGNLLQSHREAPMNSGFTSIAKYVFDWETRFYQAQRLAQLNGIAGRDTDPLNPRNSIEHAYTSATLQRELGGFSAIPEILGNALEVDA